MWVVIVAIGQTASVWADAGPPLQPSLSIVFVLTVPGFVILDLEQPKAFTARLMLGVAGSIGLNVALVTLGLLPSFVWIAAVGVFAFWGTQRYLAARLLRLEVARASRPEGPGRRR